jgi:hypothetical protein
LHEELLLSLEKNKTSLEASCYFSLLSEIKTFIEELLSKWVKLNIKPHPASGFPLLSKERD